jgi:serine/threonine protein kinase
LIKERFGQHPRLVRIYDVFFEKPPYYLEMQYIEGRILSGWAASMPMEVKLEIVCQAAEGLQAAHDAGVIHRDVKPSNIIVKGEGKNPGDVQVKLMDFGIGQLVEKKVEQYGDFSRTIFKTDTSSKTGTQMYMAPEVLDGKPSTIRSDIYSLSIVLYQLVTGTFGQSLTTDWRKNITDPLLREDLEKCLAGKPEERFSGVSQLAERLRTLEQRRTRIKRRKLARITIAAAGFLLIAFAFTGLLYYRMGQRMAAAEQELYFASISQTQTLMEKQEYDKARKLLFAGPEKYRHWEWGRLLYLCNLDVSTLDVGYKKGFSGGGGGTILIIS